MIYPQTAELDLGLAVGTSGGGEVYVSRKGVPTLTLVTLFAGVRDEDFGVLKNWYTAVSEGPRNSFSFVDGDGTTHSVRWTNNRRDWHRAASNRG